MYQTGAVPITQADEQPNKICVILSKYSVPEASLTYEIIYYNLTF